MRNFTAHSNDSRQEMLNTLGIKSVDELFKQLPVKIDELGLEAGKSELDVQRIIKSLANKNKTDYITFMGGGCYNKFIPAAISQVAQKVEFLTAYTPYQPEISQGTLQVIYEYQTMICMLTGMDVANASVYDGGSACAEAVSMACRISKKHRALVSERLNPEYKKVIETYAWGANIEIEWFDTIPEDTKEYACVLVQNPDYYGEITEPQTPDCLLVVCTTPASLAVMNPPVQADIVVGDVQTLGIAQSFGGAHAGFMACKEKYMRQLPGRLAGKTVDADGNTAYTLTLQTREQHIRREKATSNICSNQALVCLCSALYLSLLGEKGFRQAEIISVNLAHELSEKLKSVGVWTLNKNFLNEFTIEVNDSDEVLNKLKSAGILGGIRLSKDKILVCTTEMNSVEDIEKYVSVIKQ